jgi:hypothetical protein
VLRYLVTQDVRDRRLLPALLTVIEQLPDQHELHALAMVVLMRIHGDTRYARELADLAARAPGGKAEAILIEYAPEVGGLLARGTRLLMDAPRTDLGDGPRAEVEEFLSLAVASPAAATERLRMRLRAASPNDVV